MNNAERGLFIIDYFTELQEEVEEIGGLIRQSEPEISLTPICGTVACIGGWIANKEQTKIYTTYFGRGERCYMDGVNALKAKLDIPPCEGAMSEFVRNTQLWHNRHSYGVFTKNQAYAADNFDTLTIEDVCNYWILFGYELLIRG